MDLKKLTKIVIALFFSVTISACQSHNCECGKPNEITITSSTKGNKNEARLKCEQANEIEEKSGGSCIY